MPKEPIRAPLGVNVPGLTMAGFQLTLHGRIWVIPEDPRDVVAPLKLSGTILLTLPAYLALDRTRKRRRSDLQRSPLSSDH